MIPDGGMLQKGLFLAVVFACNLIQMIGAFAGTMLAMPVSILLIGPAQARVVLGTASLLSCIYPVCRNFSAIRWKEVARIILVMLIGIAAGQLVFSSFDTGPLLLCYGLLVVAVAVKNFIGGPRGKFPAFVGILILLAAGMIHGLFLSGGSLLVIYALQKFKNTTEFRASLSAVWIVLNGSIVTLYALQGQLRGANLRLTAWALLPALLGVLLGDLLQKKINGPRFVRFANILLLLSGLLLLLNCLSALQ